MTLRKGQEVDYVMPAVVDSEEQNGMVFIKTEVGRLFVPVVSLMTFPEPEQIDRSLPEGLIVGKDGSV